MATLVDRANALRQKQDAFTGIDFVRVEDPCDQTILRIYLITDATQLEPPFVVGGSPEDTSLKPENILIDSVTDPSLPRIPVVEIFEDAGSQVQFDPTVQRHYIEIRVAEPGTFARYRLRIQDPLEDLHPESPELSTFSRIDRFFNDKVFSFKVACNDENDCVPPGPECPVDVPVDFPVDYQARDFVSLRNALLDFAAQRYPHWSLPVEADVGMMLTEVMAALGDEFSYIQDRHAREAFLETATERRSLRKKARLLDYEIHDGRSASTLLELTIDTSAGLPPSSPYVRAGSRISALSESGEAVPFEIGTGLFDRVEQGDELVSREYPVRVGWNASRLEPYLFDDSQACLEVGSTEIFLIDKIEGLVQDTELLVTDPDSGDRPRVMLLRTDPEDLSVPARSHFVRISSVDFIVDPLPDVPVTVTRIRWDARDALPFQMDQNVLKVSLNVVPATAGQTVAEKFAVRPEGLLADEVLVAVEREGPQKLPSVEREGTTLDVEANERPSIVLLGLPGTEAHGLGFLGSELRNTTPEIEVVEDTTQGNAWSWVRSILDALPGREVFTLEDGVWRRIRGFRKIGGEFVHRDYATGSGFTVRFGDGEFGRVPANDSRFIVRYRTGSGARGNVPAGSINVLSEDFATQWWVTSAQNPQAVTDGVDPESAREIRLLAPEAYQSDVLFALRPSDYGRQAQRFDFVQRAQGTARWTGTWPSIFVSADPFGAANLSREQRDTLEAWMDCVRQAGREVIVREPQTIGIDLVIVLCIEPTAYAAHVLTQAQELMLGRGLDGRPKGFFHPDNFSFGTPLRRSALEATLQGIPGVQSVRRITLRLRGAQRFRIMRELVLKVGRDQILRLDNDPLRPEHGSLRFVTQGGA